jgi:hypothetical protein
MYHQEENVYPSLKLQGLLTVAKCTSVSHLNLIKMFRSVTIACIVATVMGFGPHASVARSSMTRTRLSMSAEFLPGAVAPLGYWDPLGLSKDKGEGDVKIFRESELKHGRVAMIAFLGILVAENFNPLFDNKITGPAIYQYQQAEDLISFFSVQALFGTALVEIMNISKGYESADDTNKRKGTFAQLKKEYVNGMWCYYTILLFCMILQCTELFYLIIVRFITIYCVY